MTSKINIDEIKQYLNLNFTQVDIANLFNVSDRTIRRYVKQLKESEGYEKFAYLNGISIFYIFKLKFKGLNFTCRY
jgi:transcriptional antiterminator